VSQGTNRALTDLFARWGTRRNEETARPQDKPAAAGGEKTLSTKAFGKFLSALSHREAPVLLDLGPVVGTNINFFGERLGCKFFVEDVYANVEKFAKENRGRELGDFLGSRFPQPDASFDGILCWDIFDYLDKNAGPVLARELTRLLKPGGALLGFFQTIAAPEPEYTRYLVVDDKTFKHRPYPAARGRQQVLVNRDINRMFEGLTVWESFLLMTKTREIVFRKPEQKGAGETPAAEPAIRPVQQGATLATRAAALSSGKPTKPPANAVSSTMPSKATLAAANHGLTAVTGNAGSLAAGTGTANGTSANGSSTSESKPKNPGLTLVSSISMT
jgi:SAM-dependent methyltransferase